MDLNDMLLGLAELNSNQSTIEISGLSLDSRQVSSGNAFVAVPGSQFKGSEFIESAFESGAAVVLIDDAINLENLSLTDDQNSRIIRVKRLKALLGGLADRFYGQPSSKISVTGVTGTNGKTSTVSYLAQLYEAFDQRTTVMGTLGVGHWQSLKGAINTTPDVISVHKSIRDCVNRLDQNFVMEVSSHGLEQGRLDQIHFENALYTNLSHDHLDFHGTMEAYSEAKQKLFKTRSLNLSVINLDDDYAHQMIEASVAKRTLTYSLNKTDADVYVKSLKMGSGGMFAQLHTWKGDVTLDLALIGEFNLANVLGCFTLMIAQGLSIKEVADACNRLVPAPGRMQLLKQNDVAAIIDYAHTPDALEKALIASRSHCKGKLHVVFGCGGDRDTDKRPVMAKIAETLSDEVWLTDDNPRTESPDKIFSDIEAGFSHIDAIHKVHDRGEAIRSAIENAKEGDLVLIAGKGHENYQEIEKVRHHFDDAEHVRKVMGL